MPHGAVILAAGISSRMGEFKPLLPMGEETVIRNVVRVLQTAGVSRILVVTGYQSEVLQEHLAHTGVMFVHNERFAQTQMFDSVRLGLAAMGDSCEKILLTPADVPLVQPDTVLTVLPAVFGVFVLLDSLGRIQNALELRRAGLVRWWGMLFFALLSVVLGVLILINPFAALTTTVRVIGAVLLIESVLGLACALYTSLVLRELEKAVRDAGDDLMEV